LVNEFGTTNYADKINEFGTTNYADKINEFGTTNYADKKIRRPRFIDDSPRN